MGYFETYTRYFWKVFGNKQDLKAVKGGDSRSYYQTYTK